ncbi:MAG: NrtA/SsuA/CpmA family ABC transporter substrate-binding protein [Methanomicrobiales archaeon]|nr:NrtA/SsuA/CpmA family ABC transporter substrate-binding protein [Methanomicrobiales archaeon]
MDTCKRGNPCTWKFIGIGIIVIILLIALVLIFVNLPAKTSAGSEQLIIASGTQEPSLLTLIADEKGYFQKHGLNVTIHAYPAGTYAVKELLAGNADLAYAAEFVGVANSFQSPDLRFITTTAKINNLYVIIRSDRGISTPSDLKGKTIAVPKGSVAEFFLGRYLTLNGMNTSQITVLHLAPADAIKSVVSGDSDAVVIWEPYAYQTEQQLGRNSTRWRAQSGQFYYWVSYARSDLIRDKPEVIRKYLRALDEAETFATSHEPETKEILQRRLNMTDESVNSTLKDYRFVLSLDQALIVEMEDEARWMTEQNMTGGNARSSYLDMVSQEALREVKPSAVTIIR